MSTKIYDGFRFVSSDLLAIHRDLMAYRPVVDAAVRAATCRFAAVYAARQIDAAALKGEGCASPLSGCMRKLWDRQHAIKASGRRDPEVDFAFSLAVLPFEGRVYGIVYCEQRPWADAFLDQPWIERFPYWNNTDGPDEITEADWEARGDLWRRLLKQDHAGSRPSACGFSVEMCTPQFGPDRADILAHVPSRALRISQAARANVIEAAGKHLYAAVEERGGTPDPVRIFLDAERALREGKLDATLHEEVGRVEALIPEITLDMLTTGFVPGREVAA